MASSQGFWSYVHLDDDAEGGRISQLARDIVNQYELITGESVDLFLDKDGLEWGSDWEAKIQTSLASVAFFVPILTPRYFASGACRSELNTFARRAEELGVGELLLPILYTDVPGIDDRIPSDELLALVKKFQWADWRSLRFEERTSADYRKNVVQLAQRIADANRSAESAETTLAVIEKAELADDEAGVLELMAGFESALPRLTATTQQIALEIGEIGAVVSEVSEEVQLSPNTSFAKRLIILRELAKNLTPPATALSLLGDEFTKELHDVDLGVRAIISRAPEEPDSRSSFCDFFTKIRELVVSAETGLAPLQKMVDSAAPLEKLSRDVRPPLRDMRRGLSLVMEGQEVMRAWATLIDASGIDCGSDLDE